VAVKDVDIDALGRLVAICRNSPNTTTMTPDCVPVPFVTMDTIVAALEDYKRDMSNFGDQIAAAHDMARFHRERAERLRDVARKVCTAMDLPAIPGDTSEWVRVPGADILALETALGEKP
jgi:hypothetical protein